MQNTFSLYPNANGDERPPTADELMQKLLERLTPDQVEELIDYEGPYKDVAEAVVGWNALFLQGLKKRRLIQKTKGYLAASMLVLGSITRWAFALGVKEGLRLGEQK